MIHALLWDNDGVLIDSERIFFETTRRVFGAAGLELSPGLWAARYLGDGLCSRQIARLLGAPPELAERLVERRNRLFRRRLELPVPVLPGVRRVFERWHPGCRMAVVTGSPRRQFDLIHRHTGLLPYLDCVVTADDCERVKPDPAAYLTALDRLGIGPEHALAVEDSPRGLASATAAGIRCVVIRTPLTHLEACAAAHAVLEHPGELDRILRENGAARARSGEGCSNR
jgi:HAD superfamily hydrolase (TIGR01509 family)